MPSNLSYSVNEDTYAELNRELLEAQLSEIRRRLAGMGVRKAILFGSLARDEVTPFSDLDLIIVQETDARFLDRLEPFYAGSTCGWMRISWSTRRKNWPSCKPGIPLFSRRCAKGG